ncbi:MAG: diacylglycerol kinase [Candidatus Omnitrophota bacterium]|nr:diacylglycerol kinase [Candidatus Omnitrophota bacterium]
MRSYRKPERFFNNRFVQSVNAALEGVVHTLQTERNMRLHFLLGFLVLLGGIYFSLSSVEFMLLCFAVTFVLVAEMFNTAIEHAIDLISDEFHPRAKIIKDIAAGAVFVSAVNAAIVGYILLVKRIGWELGEGFFRIKQSPWHITLIVLLIVIGLVLFIKVLRGEKMLLKGGMPSGHSAVAFAIWMTVSLVTGNSLVSILVFLLALLIAKSRMGHGVHNLWEVLAGSVLGVLVALLVFQLLS